MTTQKLDDAVKEVQKFRFVEVTKERFDTFKNSLLHNAGYHEGVDVGRTHGCGYLYVDGKEVGSWRWILERNAAGQSNRVWSHKIRADLAEDVPMLIEKRYFVIDLTTLTEHQKSAIEAALNLLAIESKEGVFFGVRNPLYNQVRDLLNAHLKDPLNKEGEE